MGIIEGNGRVEWYNNSSNTVCLKMKEMNWKLRKNVELTAAAAATARAKLKLRL
jgi:hypothetical protein